MTYPEAVIIIEEITNYKIDYMKSLNFKNKTYEQVERTETPQKYNAKTNNIDVKVGKCLNNSSLISKRFTEVNMVEGFLITYFEDGKIESVGHVWNEIEGVYFDETIDLKKSDEKITKSEYYFADKYTSNDVSFEQIKKTTSGLSSFFEEPIIEIYLVFKTDVKKLEIELKEYLNNN